MSAAKELLAIIEDLEVPHLAYSEQHDFLKQRVELAIAGYGARTYWVLGPSRVGKSMLISAIARENPETRVDGNRRVPVVVAEVPEGVSPQHLPGCVIDGLGLVAPRGNVGHVRGWMYKQLERAETKVILFEEASHIVDIGTKVPPSAAGDFFKSLVDKKITLVLSGLPRLRKLVGNVPLRLRSSRPREFNAYDFRIPEERDAFLACILVFAKKFEEAGWPLGLRREALFANCYLLAGGLVGIVSAFFRELATQRIGESPRTLTLVDLRAAADEVESADPRWRAFKDEAVAPVHLISALACVREANLMPIAEASSVVQEGV